MRDNAKVNPGAIRLEILLRRRYRAVIPSTSTIAGSQILRPPRARSGFPEARALACFNHDATTMRNTAPTWPFRF